jgi:hypothetical protein
MGADCQEIAGGLPENLFTNMKQFGKGILQNASKRLR